MKFSRFITSTNHNPIPALLSKRSKIRAWGIVVIAIVVIAPAIWTKLQLIPAEGQPPMPTPTATNSTIPTSLAIKATTPTNSPAPTSVPSPTYTKKVLVLSYFPLTANGQNIDSQITGDVGDSYEVIKNKTETITHNLISDVIPRATTYHGYKTTGTPPAITMEVVETIVHTTKVPIHSQTREANYFQLLSENHICDYVDNKGVDEVFIWAYQGPSTVDGKPYLGISESKMSRREGDISNSYRLNDMPLCRRTYVIYTFNYQRGTAEAFHSWSHQIEAELRAIDSNLFGRFQGSNTADMTEISAHTVARCGTVHHPPNAQAGYDYANPTARLSDCLQWSPQKQGSLSEISCQLWGCVYISDTDNPHLNYLIWYWQNLPGLNNSLQYNGRPLRNFWDIHIDFDSAMRTKTLLRPE